MLGSKLGSPYFGELPFRLWVRHTVVSAAQVQVLLRGFWRLGVGLRRCSARSLVLRHKGAEFGSDALRSSLHANCPLPR